MRRRSRGFGLDCAAARRWPCHIVRSDNKRSPVRPGTSPGNAGLGELPLLQRYRTF
jgi:hypothetical protein